MDHSNLIEQDLPVDLESGRNDSDKDGSAYVNYDSINHLKSVVIDVKVGSVDVDVKKLGEQHKKNSNNKAAAKPPRPPRGPSLDAADQKFIRELTELTVLKRIRTERIRALKKMKAAKSSSSSSNSLFATMFTIVFCCVILLQGISDRTSSHASVDGSPSSVAPEPGLISVQYVRKPNPMSPNMLVSGSPSVVEQVSGQAPHEIANSASV